MDLASIFERYRARFLQRHGARLTPDQWSAFNAITGCRTGQYGSLVLACGNCPHQGTRYCSCGHRACNRCQQHSAQQWLARQEQKLLPVDYYMATFTLPFELRSLARRHPRQVYNALLQCAASTLKRFGLNQRGFEAELGLCAVLHTHTRRLDYHPHVHVVVPGGGVERRRREWRKAPGHYLFNGRALAAAFRGALLKTLADQGLTLPATPKRWVAQCQRIGKGQQALRYLSRYLYRGVISNRNLVADDGTNVTFRFKDSQTQQWQTRRVAGEEFIFLVLQHVLPKGFRRARDFGFLHGNARHLLRIVQWVLGIRRPSPSAASRPPLVCPACAGRMFVCGVVPARMDPG